MSSEQLFYEIIVTDKFGKVVAREHRKSQSYLIGYNQSVLTGMSQVDQTIKLIDGSNVDSVHTATLLKILDLIGAFMGGIVVGSSNVAVDISDYKLGTMIAHGTGVGELSYEAHTIGVPTVGATESAFEVKRIIINHSGGDVTVWELGIYTYCTTTAPYLTASVRDVLGGAVVVPDGGAITVIYTIKAVE